MAAPASNCAVVAVAAAQSRLMACDPAVVVQELAGLVDAADRLGSIKSAAAYGDVVEEIDTQVGRLIARLKALGAYLRVNHRDLVALQGW